MQSQETVSWVAVTTTTDGFDSTYVEADPVELLALVAGRTSVENADVNAPAVIVGQDAVPAGHHHRAWCI